jgi:HEAT repeat protein
MRPRGAGAAWIAALALAPAPLRAAVPAAGGRPLVPAARAAEVTVAGTLADVRSLDAHGYAATLAVERVLGGPVRPGDALVIAWEELATGRPVRFAEGGRVLVALEAPAGSLWRQRMGTAPFRVVAARGDAFVRDPDAASLDALGAWLALPRDERTGSGGAAALAGIAAKAREPLAAGSLDLLEGLAAELLEGEPAARLGRALLDRSRPPALRARIAHLAGRARLASLRGPLETLRSRPDEPPALRGAALEALAAQPPGPPAGALAAALESPDAALRAAAVRSDGSLAAERLGHLASRDPAPEVRSAALARLAGLPAEQALGPVLAALEDPDPEVREAAIRAGAGLGDRAVPPLEERAFRAGIEGARAPLAVLALAGPAGRAALAEIARDHGDDQVRALARVLLGRPAFPGH